MKSQYLLSLSTSATLALGMIFIGGKSAVASDAAFHCQSDQETPATVAKTSNGAEQPIFHWNLDKDTVSNPAKELCNSVTQKLNNYMSEGNDLSSLTFQVSRVFPEDPAISSLPAICVADENGACGLSLFTLEPSVSPKLASAALDSILDPALQSTKVEPKSVDRGFQSTSYEVNFWDLLGINKWTKEFKKFN
ncbi:MAG: COP23 domain-containing protein [Pleurocapsa sp.]